MDSISVGLDIGSSAVRAAEVEINGGRRSVRRFAQVGLPHGAVADGEVVNAAIVTEALRRLWAEGGFTTNKVVLGVSGPRVFVRQADVPVLADEDLRSSLRFDGQELVPIPMEEASFDFSVLERPDHVDPNDDAAKMRILLVAAHKDVLRAYLGVLKAAGLEAVAMDSTALALLRAVPPAAVTGGSAGLEVLVSIGAELTTVAVRDNGTPRFIRTLTVGGSRLTASIANTMHLEMAVAERLKRGGVEGGSPQVASARKAVVTEIRDLAEDIRATVDFFLAQSNVATIDRLMITGGAAQTEGLAAAIAGNLPVEVYRVAPFAGLATDQLGFDPATMERAGAAATSAVGLAMWPHESPLVRLSILPEEVAQARHARRLFQLAAGGIAGLTALLALAGTAQVLRVHSAQSQARAAQDQVASLSAQVARLHAKTAVHEELLARASLDRAALQGDIDWVRLIGQMAGVLPPNIHILSFSASRAAATSVSGSVGSLNVSVQGQGDASVGSQWLDALQTDPSLKGTWIGGIAVAKSSGGETTSFSSTSNLTSNAQSGRAEGINP